MRAAASPYSRTLIGVVVLALMAALCTPTLWTMHCVGTTRTTLQWGHAKECMPAPQHTDGSSVRAQCCTFTSVNSQLDDYTAQEQFSTGMVGAVFALYHAPTSHRILTTRPVVPQAHGPPLAVGPRSLFITGQLRV